MIFNYIITIHNKQDLIAQVVESVIACCHEESHIYAVLDGCTDNSEAEIDRVLARHPGVRLTKVHTADLHETLSLNAGLNAANQEQDGFNITLQDDVILQDPQLEQRVRLIYEHLGYERVGVLSFRAGANMVCNDTLHELDEVDLVESAYGSGIVEQPLLPGRVVERMIGIRSPECISTRVIRQLGTLDERLAPYSYCAHDLGLRCLEQGYHNYVFALPFASELKWGGTRGNPHPEYARIHRRNRRYLYYKHKAFLARFERAPLATAVAVPFSVPGVATDAEADHKATEHHRAARLELNAQPVSPKERVKSVLRGLGSHHTWKRLQRRVRAQVLAPLELKRYAKYRVDLDRELTFTQVAQEYPRRDDAYRYLHHVFEHRCAQAVREHRRYFATNGRGFGENAQHAAWDLLLPELKPRSCLEIGVFRGQVVSLWTLLAERAGFACEVHAISPFSPAADAVSRYSAGVDYLQDTLRSFDHFGLPHPTTVRALSTDPAAVAHIQSRQWDLIYIDGCHDFEVVLGDYQLCKAQLAPGGVLAIDDSSLDFPYNPPAFAFAGHPGPSTVASMYAQRELQLIGSAGHLNFFRRRG